MNDLSQLLQRIKTQLEHEYTKQSDRDYVLKNMTVERLLEMLEYMGPEND